MDKKFEHIVERIVREEISQLLEYAYTRSDYIFRVENLFKQIIIHFCLIKHNRYINNEKYIQHWKHELFGWINSLSNMDMKKNNNPKNRLDAIIQALNNIGYLEDINKIKNCLIPKLRKENIDANSEPINYAINECQKTLPYIANIIANNDMITCDNFINDL